MCRMSTFPNEQSLPYAKLVDRRINKNVFRFEPRKKLVGHGWIHFWITGWTSQCRFNYGIRRTRRQNLQGPNLWMVTDQPTSRVLWLRVAGFQQVKDLHAVRGTRIPNRNPNGQHFVIMNLSVFDVQVTRFDQTDYWNGIPLKCESF